MIVTALAAHEGHTAAVYLAGAEVTGTAWYLLYLRPRIANRTVGACNPPPSLSRPRGAIRA